MKEKIIIKSILALIALVLGIVLHSNLLIGVFVGICLQTVLEIAVNYRRKKKAENTIEK